MNDIIDQLKPKMQKALDALTHEFNKIRTGRANPNILDTVKIDYYGTLTPISQAANISVEEGRTLAISAWDKSLIGEIEKAIMKANIGFNPMNNGENIIINVPPLTEERRRGLAKQAKAEAEHAKVGVRSARKEANNEVKKLDVSDDMKKNVEADVQQLTDTFVKKTEELFDLKEKEIMTV